MMSVFDILSIDVAWYPWLVACLCYGSFINLFSFFLMAMDKRRAIRQKWRISEHTFFLLSLFGGAFGVWAGMRVFHHKTKKKQFVWMIVPLLLIQTIITVIFLYSVFFMI